MFASPDSAPESGMRQPGSSRGRVDMIQRMTTNRAQVYMSRLFVAVPLTLVLTSCGSFDEFMKEHEAEVRRANAQESRGNSPQPLDIPPGLKETDVYATAGAPQYVTALADGGKLLIYEQVSSSTTPSVVLDTTPPADQCVGDCSHVHIEQPRKSSAIVPGTTTTRRTIITYDIGPNGLVRSGTRSQR